MRIVFTKRSWDDYTYWQAEDKKIIKRINLLIKDISRSPFEGLGSPEPLKFDLSGYWSRRINKEHRLVYKYKNNEVLIYACRFHYDN